MSSLSVNLLGSFAVNLDGHLVENLRANPVRALLIYLAVERSQAQRREVLCTLLWPGMPEKSARHNLSQTLYALRQAFPAVSDLQGEGSVPLLVASRQTVQLNPAAQVDVDLHQMNRFLTETRQHAHPKLEECENCITVLKQAAALYRSDFLSDFYLEDSSEFEGWAEATRESYRRKMKELLATLADIAMLKGDHNQALAHIDRQLDIDSLDERAYRQKIKMLALAGRRVEALRQYRMFEQLLDEQLGIAPSQETITLYKRIRAEDLAVALPTVDTASAKNAAPRHNLPLELTSFIGRENEIFQVKELLSQNRMVTLTGVGGTGKTRLALQVAGGVLENYPNGVWLVELAGLADPSLVPRTMASALNLPEVPGKRLVDSLVAFLRAKRLLLVLDNCEHLLEACTSLADRLLRSCPGLNILASSREFLGIAGEIPYRLPPMSMPDTSQRIDADRLSAYDAVKLFIDRAQVADPRFTVTEENALAVVRVVERLDGLPLAIELAAARLRLLGVSQVLNRLDDAFRLLTGGGRSALPRHQTLRASIDWSYNLLSEPERVLLRRLSVFSGSWRMSAAKQVCADLPGPTAVIHPDEILDLVTGLLDKSLIQTVSGADGRNRFRMLETVRQYAGEKLAIEKLGDKSESQAVRDRHLAYYLEWVEVQAPKIRGPEQVSMLDQFERELDNLRLAMAWGLQQDIAAELKISTAMMWFWHIRSFEPEGIKWLSQGLEMVEGFPEDSSAELSGTGIDPLVRARAMTALGLFRWMQFHNRSSTDHAPEQAKSLLEGAISIYQAAGAERDLIVREDLAWAQLWLAHYIGTAQGDLDRARELAQEPLAVFHTNNNSLGIAECLQLLGFYSRDPAEASIFFQEQLAIQESRQDPHGMGNALMFGAIAAARNGEYETARQTVAASQVHYQQIKDLTKTVQGWGFLGVLYQYCGDLGSADEYNRQSLVSAYDLGIESSIVNYLYLKSLLRIAQGRYQQAAETNQEALHIAQRTGIQSILATALESCIRLARLQGNTDQVEVYIEMMSNLSDLPPEQKSLVIPFEKGHLALWLGDLEEAGDHFREMMHLLRQLNWENANMFDGLALLALKKGELEHAARLFGSRWCRGYAHFLSPIEKEWRQPDLEAMRAALGAERFEHLYEEGKSMTYKQIVDLATEMVSQDP